MAKAANADPRRLYSWWWDSHISPKNSKWLQENLRDLDVKVSLMIRLLEADGDSFARKAEMYYKKRPELMKLVEEFYRAYRALAERYDHATGALRQAHRTIQEAFPNQIASLPSDEFPGLSEPHTPEMLPQTRLSFEAIDLPKEAFDAIKRGEENDGAAGRRGIKQLNEIFAPGKARKGLNFLEDEGKGRNGSDFFDEEELPRLRESLSKSESARDAALLECSKLSEKISSLEMDISRVCEENEKSSKERFLLFETQKMALEERVNALTQQMNDRWQDLEKVNGDNADLSQELRSKQEELDKLVSSVKEECLLRVKAEEALETSEKMNLSYQEEIKILFSDLQSKAEMLSDVEGRSRYLEEEGEKIKEENESLNTQILSSASIMKNLRDEIAALEEACVRLEDEARERANEKNVLQQKIDVLQDEVSDLDLKLRCVLDQIEAVGLSEESFQVSVSEMQRKNQDLMERCDKFEDERVLLVRQLEEVTEKNALLEESLSLTTDELEGLTAKMTSTEDEKAALLGNIERETEKGLLLEKSLSNTSAELEREREKTTSFEESCASLTQRIQELGAENDGLSQQLEATARSLENISNNNTLLENLLSNASGEIGGLREKVQSMNSEMEELQVSFKDKEAVLVGQLEGAAAKNTVLEKSLVESTAELEGLKSKERSLEESCASFNRRVTELMAENGILAHQMEKFTEDNISLENSLTEANGLIRELRETIQGLIQTHEGEKAALVGQSEREREKSAVLERSLSETRSELDVERERARALENSCESLNRRTQELAQENNSISQEMKSSLSNANGEIEGLREKLQSMNSELGRLQETFKDKEAILIVQRDEGAEKSMILEESLSRTTAELEGLKLKERSLEDCCDSLNRKIAEIAANNSSLVHQLEELSEKNVTLDSSLSDARSESEGLREKLKILDESMKSLWEENSSLLSEKASLTSQVENVSSSVDKVTKRHADLEGKHLNLERERENTLSLVDELRSLLNLSQQGCRHKDEELERLNEELLDLQIRSFIYENHLIHADECFWKLLKSFSLMREENLSQKKAIESASEHKKNLHNGIDMVLEILGIEHASEEAESRFQNIIIKIKEIEKALSDAVDDNSLLILRESVLSVFLQQLGLDLMHLNSENSSKGKQLLGLMRERQELLLSNEELTEAVHVGQRRESLLMDELSDLRSDIKNLEEENSSTLLETLSLSSLSLLFERLAAEREMNLTALEAKMTELTEKSAILKTQNSFLGDSITLLNQQVEIGKNSLSQKDSELAEAIQKVNALEDAQLKLCADFDAIRVRLNDSIRMIEELEGKICEMTEEIRSYEEEVSKLWADSHISAVYAQIYKEKMLELIGECASLEEKVIVAQTDSDSLEREHRTLKETLIAYLPLVLTLQESLRNLEREILTLIKHHGLKSGSEQEISATISDPREIDHPSEQIHSIDDPYGFMGLEKLQFRIASLQELIKLSASSTSKMKNEEETHKSLQDSTISNRILETDDQMLRLWEAAERDNSILLSLKGEEQSRNPSSNAKREKEGIDQMGLSRKVNSRRDWSKRISDRLAADAQRLLALEKSTAELKTQLEKSGASSRKSTEMKYEAMRGRVKKVEEAVSELVNSNAVSARRAEGSVDQKKQVVEEVQSESEKIGRLELELQKIQYIILKIDEERKTGARGGGRQSRTVLRDYFYGRGEGDGHKRGWLCGSCVHSSTVSK